MVCQKCGYQTGDQGSFCRACGANLPSTMLAENAGGLAKPTGTGSADPDQLIGEGIASMFMGDGFFFVGVLLTALESSVQSFLWLFLLIPAFFFFGKGVSNILYARQIRRRLKEAQPKGTLSEPSAPSFLEAASVTERTTRNLR